MNERIYTFKDGRETIFDAKDAALICQFNLNILQIGYVRAYCKIDGKRYEYYLHRLIMNPPHGMVVDHINGDILDNRRINLRICTQGQNRLNSIKRKGAISQYKGVRPAGRNWYTMIKIHGKSHYLGMFKSEIEAAMAYNKKAIELHGEHAKINVFHNN